MDSRIRWIRLSTLISILLVSLLAASLAAAAADVDIPAPRHKYESHAATGDLVCRPFGECEPCPVDELYKPYCHPYGNRRLVHCIPHSIVSDEPYADASEIASEIQLSHNASSEQPIGENAPHVIGNVDNHLDAVEAGKGGEIPAWESCGKVVALERARYGEFVTTNILFLIVALFILLLRANKLAAVQYRALAARIGIGGSLA